MLSSALRLTSISVCAFLLSCGGDGASQCLRDSSCDPGFRCEISAPGEPGKCIACEGTEVVYDGLDNDCNSRTLDLDLDGDGDNFKGSQVQPGGDCDDNDPAVSSKLRERCDDRKDNNCDGTIDEAACRDLQAPTISFRRPNAGDPLHGRIDVELDVTDDVGIKQVELFANDQSRGTLSTPPFIFQLDTTTLSDGQVTLRAVAIDVADRSEQASIIVSVDNFSGPAIIPLRPQPGHSYGGRMTVNIEASDAAGVASLSLSIDGANLGTFTSTPVSAQVDTRGLTDGIHTVQVAAVDRTGATSNLNIDFLVDNTGPVVTVAASPINMGAVEGQITVTVNATDPGGIGSILSRGSSASGTDILTYSLDTLAIPNGPFVLTATAADTAEIDDGAQVGNVSSGSLSVNINNPTNAPPRVVLTAPVAGEGVYRRTIMTADANSAQGVQRVSFFVNGTLVGFDETTPFALTWDFSRYQGIVTIAATALDGAGVEATDSATVTVVRPATFRAPTYVFPFDAVDDARHRVADVNGDGLPDLVMGGTGVSLALGLGAGAFGIAQPISQNRSVEAVEVGDVTGDGAPDIVALRTTSIEVFINDGGNFLTYTNYPIGNFSASDLDLGDLNGDGRLDVIAARGNPGGDIIVMLNRDNMGFGDIRSFGQAGNAFRIVLADIEGDGDLDAVLGRKAGGDDYFTVYRNDGTGTFGAGLDTILSGQPYSVAVGDINRDGVLDVVATLPAPGNTRDVVFAYGVQSSPGQFTLGHTVEVGSGPSGVALGDMDGDGDLEAVVTAEKSHTLTVLTRISDTNYSRADYVVARDARHPILADVDVDGDLDVAVNSASNDAVAIVFNRNGLMLAPPAIEIDASPGGLVLTDLSGDGRPEAIVAKSGTGISQPAAIDFFADQQGRYVFDHSVMLTGQFDPSALAIGNLDNLGGPDFALASLASSSRLVIDGGGTPTQITLAVPRSRDVAIGDVDNDGAEEAIFSFDQNTIPSGDGLRVFNGAGVLERDLVSGEGAAGIIVGRLNGDALIDVAVGNIIGDNVAFFTVSGGSVSQRVFSGIPGAYGLALGRVGPAPADSINDLLVSGTNRVGVLRGHPTLDFIPPTTWDAAGNPTVIGSGDFNGDGLSDLVGIHPVLDRITVLIARERGGFFGPDLIDIGDEPVDLQVGDVDGDGKMDVVAISSRFPMMAVVYNDN